MLGLDHSEKTRKKSRELGEVGGRYLVCQRGLQSVAEIEGQLGEKDLETIHSRT